MKCLVNARLLLALLLLFTVGCSENAATSSNKADKNRDVVYLGVLPCADCEGIETKVTLHQGDRYTIHSVYLGTDQPAMVDEGTFTRHRQESRIVLDDGRQFKQGDSTLLHLTMDGQVITSSLAEHYVLKKIQ